MSKKTKKTRMDNEWTLFIFTDTGKKVAHWTGYSRSAVREYRKHMQLAPGIKTTIEKTASKPHVSTVKLTTCDGCNKPRRDVRSCGRDANGDPDAPDLCFLCRLPETYRVKKSVSVTMIVDEEGDRSVGISPSRTQVDIKIHDPRYFEYVDKEDFIAAFRRFLADWFDVPLNSPWLGGVYEKNELEKMDREEAEAEAQLEDALDRDQELWDQAADNS